MANPEGGNGTTATLTKPAKKNDDRPVSKKKAIVRRAAAPVQKRKKAKATGITKAGEKFLSGRVGTVAKWTGLAATSFWLGNFGYRMAKGSSMKNAAKAAFGFTPIEVE